MKTKVVELCNFGDCDKYCSIERCLVCGGACCVSHSHDVSVEIGRRSRGVSVMHASICFNCLDKSSGFKEEFVRQLFSPKVGWNAIFGKLDRCIKAEDSHEKNRRKNAYTPSQMLKALKVSLERIRRGEIL